MKELLSALEKATYNRLLNINLEIKSERLKNKPVDELKIYRRDTDQLLSAIKTTTDFSFSNYDALCKRFINPNRGESQ